MQMQIQNHEWHLPLPTPLEGCERLAGINTLAEIFYSHIAIAVSYMVIAIMIAFWVFKRPALRVHRHGFFYVYCLFIMLCGLSHLGWVYSTFVSPRYDLKAHLLLATAIVSVIAVCITPASLHHFSVTLHDYRSKQQQAVMQIEALSAKVTQYDLEAKVDRAKAYDLLRHATQAILETKIRMDETSEVARKAAERLLERNPPKES